MVSDFIDKHNGFLCLAKCERGRYWTGDRFLAQIKTAGDITEIKYPPSSHTVVFILDERSCHCKFDERALVARNIPVKDGGSRRVQDTVWAGQPQSMVLPDGSAKGLQRILNE